MSKDTNILLQHILASIQRFLSEFKEQIERSCVPNRRPVRTRCWSKSIADAKALTSGERSDPARRAAVAEHAWTIISLLQIQPRQAPAIGGTLLRRSKV